MILRILFTLAISVTIAKAQLQCSAGIGYGTYKMGDFKKLQEQIKNTSPLNPHITEAFPGYISYNASLSYTFYHNQFVGLGYEFGSTGGRVSYSDYSGKFSSDQLLRYTSLMISLGDGFDCGKGLQLRVNANPGFVFSKVKLEDNVSGPFNDNAVQNFHSINVYGQPTIELIKTWKQLGVKFFCGYSFAIWQGKVKIKGGEAYLYLPGGAILTDWSGLRTGVSLVWTLKKRAEESFDE